MGKGEGDQSARKWSRRDKPVHALVFRVCLTVDLKLRFKGHSEQRGK